MALIKEQVLLAIPDIYVQRNQTSQLVYPEFLPFSPLGSGGLLSWVPNEDL